MMIRPCLIAAVLAFSPSLQAQDVHLVEAFPGFSFRFPVFLTNSNDGTDRIFVVEQEGIIKAFPNHSANDPVGIFLDISDRVACCTEKGLKGLAFHPEFENNGHFFVTYEKERNDSLISVISRFSVSPGNPNNADPLSELVILEIYQPNEFHNVAMVLFGTDGHLYIGSGDGEEGSDPGNRSQNLSLLLGKILRINVESTTDSTNYTIPTDNPFRENPNGYREEIYAWGLRNPWRFSQNSVTDDIFVGDVGESLWEEINILESGKNYGWRCYQGSVLYRPEGCGAESLYTFPVKAYPHASGNCSVIGGYVYRGYRQPQLDGDYIYGDYCTGRIWGMEYLNGQVLSDSLLVDAPFQISSFGLDEDGELYVIEHWGGKIHRFEGPPLDVPPENPLEPNTALLFHAYPNPFNPTTTISFAIPQSSFINLAVYDLLGREVAILVNEKRASGTYREQWDASGLPSGVYFYRLKAGGFVETGKLVLAR